VQQVNPSNWQSERSQKNKTKRRQVGQQIDKQNNSRQQMTNNESERRKVVFLAKKCIKLVYIFRYVLFSKGGGGGAICSI